ncbi:MAG: methyltransferase domain-containing protein, partial [Patescibacteria group bacterium]
AVIVFSVLLASLSYAPWVPARSRDLERILTLAKLVPGERFLDLGCGDGRVVRAAAARGARAVGIELSLPLFGVAALRTLGSGGAARITFGDLFATDLGNADVIYCYGMPRPLAKRLAKKGIAEARVGTRVVSYAFPIAGLVPVAIDQPAGEIPLFLYVMEGRVVG